MTAGAERRGRQLGRWRLRGDDGSMAFYLLIAIVGVALGALAVPMIVQSSQVTRSDTSRVHALDAAQAGVNVMLGRIRAAQIDGVGTSTLLPCTASSGKVNGTGLASYSTTVAYYMDDPVTVPSATKMVCVTGSGTYDPVSGSFTPRYARITSTGKDGPAYSGSTPGRTVQSTYTLKRTNSNIVGGQIRIYPPTGTSNMCMDAGSGTPVAGVQLALRACANPPTDQQVFAYRSDLTLQLLSSITSAYPTGLCLDMAAPSSSTSAIVFKTCLPVGTAPYTQQWSLNDNNNFEAATATTAVDGALAGTCLYAATQSSGELVRLGGCSSTTSSNSAWIPSPAIGAGAAQPPQLINFYEFGRCMDVTNQDPNVDHLIDYPCKQNPNPATVKWNQKFTLPVTVVGASSGTGTITTVNGTSVYCLTSPGTVGGYVVTKPCSATNGAQTWTVYNGSTSLGYSTKYTILDNGGRCLGLTAPYGSEVWSAVDVETCTGATEQKWNAAPDLSSSSVKDTDEIPNP